MSTNAPVHRTFIVTKGPGVHTIMDSFKYSFNSCPQQGEGPGMKPTIPVGFLGYWEAEGPVDNRGGGIPLSFQITGIKYESGNHGMFILEMNELRGFWTGLVKAKGFYDANKRQGILDFEIS